MLQLNNYFNISGVSLYTKTYVFNSLTELFYVDSLLVLRNCFTYTVYLFLHSYETDFIQEIIRKKGKKLAVSFNFAFRYIDDVISVNNGNLMNEYVRSILR